MSDEQLELSCCECDKPSTHVALHETENKPYCCKHWVESGHIPSDWHAECMKTRAHQKEVTK